MNPDDLEISRHAAERWMERTGIRKPGKLRKAWDAAIRAGEVVEILPQYRLKQLLNHHVQDAVYLRSGPYVFVICNNTVVTVHTATAGRWALKSK